MNEEILTTEENTDGYLETLESVPEEVRRFMWSDAFTLLIQTISKAYNLTDLQLEAIKKIALDILIDTNTPVAIKIQLADVGIVGEFQDTILQVIYEEIISRALAQIEKYKDEESLLEEETITNETASDEGAMIREEATHAPSPIEALTMIKNRLAEPRSVAPSKRDYSDQLSQPSVPEVQTPPQSVHSIDPYREIPEK